MKTAGKQPRQKIYFLKKAYVFLMFFLGGFILPVFSVYANPGDDLPDLDLVKSISEQAQYLSAGYQEGFRLLGSSLVSGAFSGFDNYRKLPNIAAIELSGVKNLAGIYRDGFLAVGSAVVSGARLSFAETKKTFSVSSRSRHFAASETSITPKESFWCWLKGLVGMDCVTPPENFASIPPKVQPSQKLTLASPPPVVPPEPPAISVPVPKSMGTESRVLSFSSIVASLKNIFAPISSVNSLDYRVTTLENTNGKPVTDPQARNDILLLSKRIDALRSLGVSNFNSNYAYTPSAMIGSDGQAVVFNSSGPNGVFEHGVSAETGTFTGGMTAGSFTTAGSLSVTGASTLGSLAAGTSTLTGNLTVASTLYIDSLNGRVGIGTSTPADTLSVNGPVYLASTTPSQTASRLYNNNGDLYWAGSLIGGASTGNWATDGTHVWRATGNVGIGNPVPAYKLDVAGAGHFSSYLDTSYIVATTSAATSTFAGNLSVSGDTTLSASLTGFLKATAGRIATSLVSLTADISGILGISNGGTGTSTAPTYGKILIGNNTNTYDLTATSSLGLMNSLAGQYSNPQIGSAQILATSSDTNIGLTIVSSGNVHTFAPYWIGTLANSRLANSTISGVSLGGTLGALTATDGTLTFSGNYDGSLARTVGLNLNQANTWTALQQFNANASTTQLTATGNTYLATTGGNVGIGTTSPYAKLSVSGQIVGEYFTATSTTATSTFNGGLSALADTNIGTNSRWYQNGQMFMTSSTTAAGNLTFGYQTPASIDSNGGLGNSFYGYQAGQSATSSSYNTGIGYQALKSVVYGGGTTGYYNTAMGYQALRNNTTGTQNTANGYRALFSNTTGTQNTANGFQALFSNTTGANNTANGVNALFSNTTGTGNNALGYAAGYGSGTLADNRSVIDTYMTFFGFQASRDAAVASTTVLTNGTAIGKNAQVGCNNCLVLGGTGADAVNVGIGTTTPYAKLSVVGEAVAQMFTATSTTATSTFSGGLSAAGSAGLTVLQNGNVGAGTAAPGARLEVSGHGTGKLLMGDPNITNFAGISLNGTLSSTNYNFVSSAVGNLYVNRPTSADIFFYEGNSTLNMVLKRGGNVGIGTTTPYSKLSVWGGGIGTGQAFEIANNASTTLAKFLDNGTGYFLGNIGIGTTTPYAKLSVVGEVVASFFTATSTTATTTVAGDVNVGGGAFTYTNSSGVTDIATLNLGAQSFESDAGILSWADMSVTSASVLGTVNSYSAQIDTNPMLTMYSESLGDGTVWKNAVGIGTTTPIATFQIQSATSTTGTTPIFDISGLTGTSFMRMASAGTLSVYGTTTIGIAGTMAGIQIGNGGICVDNDGSCTASTTGRISSITSTVGATDVAENYSSTDNLEPGDVVATNGGSTVKRAGSPDDVVIGIVSTDPGVLLGFSLDPATTTMPTLFPVALSGRVPVKVSDENGEIKKGDRLTLSSQSGVAMKATKSGQTVGIALEDWNGVGTGKILTFVNLSWQGMLAEAVSNTPSSADASDGDGESFFAKILSAVKGQITAFSEIVADKMTAAAGFFTRISADTVEVKKGMEIKDQITGDIYCVTLKNGEWDKVKGVCDAPPTPTLPPPPSAPVVPTCVSPQILVDNTCTDPPPPEPTATPDTVATTTVP